jgi:hypothetical protein
MVVAPTVVAPVADAVPAVALAAPVAPAEPPAPPPRTARAGGASTVSLTPAGRTSALVRGLNWITATARRSSKR